MDATNEIVNQDELTMRQQRDIENEIKEKTDLVSEVMPLNVLEHEYEFDDVYLKKLANLSSQFTHFRRTRPDGNCFFRAFCYSYLEHLIEQQTGFKSFLNTVRDCKDYLLQIGFSAFTTDDFYTTFREVVEKIDSLGPAAVDEAKAELHRSFNDQNISDYMVVFLRILTSGSLRKNSEFFENFLENDMSVADFCRQEVEAMYRESDHIHIIAICNALGASVRVVYMDRGGEANDVVSHIFPDDKQPQVSLLYRPGHYDILYKL